MVDEGRVIDTCRVYSSFKIQLPKEVREYLRLDKGDVVVFCLDYDGKIYIKKGGRMKRLVGKYV